MNIPPVLRSAVCAAFLSLSLAAFGGTSGSPSPSPGPSSSPSPIPVPTPCATAAGAPKALIHAETVYGGCDSLEAQQAVAKGFEVTVVTAEQWSAMTQVEFATYRMIIFGDPYCSSLPQSIFDNASVWVPVVMGTSAHVLPGNRILIGTDPVYHNSSHPTNIHLITDGISFAGALTGRTGLYFDASCDYNTARLLPLLTQLSVGAGSWTENNEPPCGGNVSLVAANPAFADLKREDLQGWSCSVHETFPTFPDDWNALAVATDTASHPTCGTDPSTGETACGEAYVLLAGVGTVVTSPDITLTPAEATNPVGTSHTVTAHVSQDGVPVSGQPVNFTVTGQNNGASGTCSSPPPGSGAGASSSGCTTDSAGNVSFTYSDANGAGDDTITASFTDSRGTKQQATAIKHWEGGGCTAATVIIDTPQRGVKIKAPATINFTGHFSDNMGAGRTAHFELTCYRKKNCRTSLDATVDPDGTIHARFNFKTTARATYTIVLQGDDGCGGTATTAGSDPYSFTIK